LSLKVETGKDTQTAVFDFAEFSVQLYEAATDYLRLVGSCMNSIKNKLRINVPEINQADAFIKKEKRIETILGSDSLTNLIGTIKGHLHHGAIPRSNLPEYFHKKSQDERKRKDQEDTENDNIRDFVFENLPPSYEQAKTAAVRLSSHIKQQFQQEKNDREERWKATRMANEEAKKRTEEPERWAVEQAEKEAKKKKKKTKTVKKVDEDGFTLMETMVVENENEKEDEEEEKDDKKEKEKEKKKEKEKEKKKEKEKEKKKEETEEKKLVPKSRVDEESYFEDTNPFGPALKEGSYESITEIQHKKNMSKGKGHAQAPQNPAPTTTTSKEPKEKSETKKRKRWPI